MSALRKPSVGSISNGTMRTVDLLGSFAWELRHISDAPELVALANEAEERENELLAGRDETEDDANCLIALFDALDGLAPPYCSFGAHEGDGAAYGFWPDMAGIEELPRVSDPGDVPDGGTGEDLLYVNDHGNVTVYGADGSVLLELV